MSSITTSRKDEIDILRRALNDMRIELKTAYGELEQRTKEFSSLLSISEILTSLPDLSNLDIALGSVLEKTLEIMKANTGGILLWDEERQMLYYRVHRGLSKKHAREACYRLGEGIAGRVAQSGESIIADEIQADAAADQFGALTRDSIRWFASVPLRSKRKVLGVLLIASHEPREFSSSDLQFLEGIARQIATAIENAKLHEEVQHKEEVRGELLREVLSIQEGERGRIARELHDETSQVLASLNASLEATAGMLPASAEQAKAMLKKTQALSVGLLDEIHRLIYELRPTLLDDLGLVAAARWLADNNLGTAGVVVNFKTTGQQRRLSLQLETTLFRVIQEAVTNIVRHAHAKNVNISLRFKKRSIRVHIRDDGRGFDVEEAISSKDRPRGLGLLGMKERAELMHGTWSMRSHPDGGTEIDIEIPINNEEVANG
jgi:signal transduction histidine kinase